MNSLSRIHRFAFLLCLLHVSFARWANRGSTDTYVASPSVAVDGSSGKVVFAGGVGTSSYLPTAVLVEVTRSSTMTVKQSRSTMRIRYPFFTQEVRGFACDSGNCGAYYGETHFHFISPNNRAQCLACSLTNNQYMCDPMASCTAYLGKCVVQEDKYLYVIGGHLGLTYTREITCYDLSTRRQASCPKKFGPLAKGVRFAACSIVNKKLVLIGGQYPDLHDTKRVQICSSNKRTNKCTIRDNMFPVPIVHTQLFPNVEGNANCEVVMVGGETVSYVSLKEVRKINVCGSSPVVTSMNDDLNEPLARGAAFVTNGMLCVAGGFTNAGFSTSVYCKNFGNTRQPTRTMTLRPTPDPTRRPTNPPSPHPTPRPTDRPTDRPTTQLPTSAPTARPTYASYDLPDWSGSWWNQNALPSGISSAVCAVDPVHGDLIFTGGKTQQSWQTISHNKLLTWSKTAKWGSYHTVPDGLQKHEPPFKFPLRDLFAVHQATVWYKDRVYICGPQYRNPVSRVELLRCEWNRRTKKLVCQDVCDKFAWGTRAKCPDLSYSPCCVSVGKYLYWIGGVRGRVTNAIREYDMERDQFTSNTPYGPLVAGYSSTSCAAWNENIYVFGGRHLSGRDSDHIQVCKKNDRKCSRSSAQLPQTQRFGRAVAIGSQIVVGCAAGAFGRAKAPAVYDPVTNTLDKTFDAGKSALNNRIDCCLVVYKGNISAIGGYLKSDVGTYSAPRVSRLTSCPRLVISGLSHVQGTYHQVRLEAHKSEYPVWFSGKNWLYYASKSKNFWIWTSRGFAYSRKLRSGRWKFYRRNGGQFTVGLQIVCSEFARPDTPNKSSDPCSTFTWDCPFIRAVIIGLCSVVGCALLICCACFYGRKYSEEREKVKRSAIQRVDSRQASDRTAGTVTVEEMFPDPEGYPMRPVGVVPADEDYSDDSTCLQEDDPEIRFDMETRPGDLDESGYHYHRTKFTQNDLFPQHRR